MTVFRGKARSMLGKRPIFHLLSAMSRSHLPYDTALITGASSGIGREFAYQLASVVSVMVLVGRRTGRLEELRDALLVGHPTLEVHVVAVDLASSTATDALIRQLASMQVVPDLLVNNAGLGDYGDFAGADWERIEHILQVNIRALTRLTHAVLPAMKELGGGGILNVSSLASVMPMPDIAVYAASKAYVTSFSESLRVELADENIQVCALCPGPVHTEFSAVARRDDDPAGGHTSPDWIYVSAREVVAGGIEALRCGRARHFPGWKVALLAGILGAMPMAVTRMLLRLRPRRASSGAGRTEPVAAGEDIE